MTEQDTAAEREAVYTAPVMARRCARPGCGHTLVAHPAGACALMMCECPEFVPDGGQA
jgi:hypothetical protein